MALTALGLLKTTLLDYPDEVAATLFTAGCNFRCPYCHNPTLVPPQPPENFLPVDEVMAFLEKRAKVLSAVCITGGEPLIHPDLPDLITRIKTMGYKVKVDTNGSFPDRIRDQHADFIAMDIKCAPERYDAVWPRAGGAASDEHAQKIRESIEIIRAAAPRYEFRTTVAPGITGPQDMPSIAELLLPGDTYVLTPFRPGTTLDPAYADTPPPSMRTLEQMCALVRERAVHCTIRATTATG